MEVRWHRKETRQICGELIMPAEKVKVTVMQELGVHQQAECLLSLEFRCPSTWSLIKQRRRRNGKCVWVDLNVVWSRLQKLLRKTPEAQMLNPTVTEDLEARRCLGILILARTRPEVDQRNNTEDMGACITANRQQLRNNGPTRHNINND